jgi:hypothetical protein
MRRLRSVVVIALSFGVATAVAQIPAGGGPIDAGPTPRGLSAIDAASCGECHEDHYREWRGSAHRASFTNALFTDEFRHRRLASCSSCHAPRSAEAGIDCAVCHVRDGAVLNPTVSGRAPHESRVAPELSDERACAACHEFDFDGQPGDRLQRTISEWRESPHRATQCQGCHLPPRADRHAHHFPGGLDEALLRNAIEVRSARVSIDGGITRVRFVLAADRAGHAVPTGDIFRRLEVRAWPEGRPDDAVSTLLARRFTVTRRRWVERGDRRVPPTGVRQVTLELEGEHDAIEYTIDLWRTPPERAAARRWPERDVRRRLAEGRVGP